MGWSIGFDSRWKRDIGYGVPAHCDYPGCTEEIDRGLGYVCGGDPNGGDHGCGLFFCEKHLVHYGRRGPGCQIRHVQLCERCGKRSKKGAFYPSPDVPVWIQHKLTDPSWEEWRKANPEAVATLADLLDRSSEANPDITQFTIVPDEGKPWCGSNTPIVSSS